MEKYVRQETKNLTDLLKNNDLSNYSTEKESLNKCFKIMTDFYLTIKTILATVVCNGLYLQNKMKLENCSSYINLISIENEPKEENYNEKEEKEEENIFPLKCSCETCIFFNKIMEVSEYYTFDIIKWADETIKNNNYFANTCALLGRYQTSQIIVAYGSVEKMFMLKDCKGIRLTRVDPQIVEAIIKTIIITKVKEEKEIIEENQTESILCAALCKELIQHKKFEINFGAKSNTSISFSLDAYKSLEKLSQELPKNSLIALSDIIIELASAIEEKRNFEIPYIMENIYNETENLIDEDNEVIYFDFTSDKDYISSINNMKEKYTDITNKKKERLMVRFGISPNIYSTIIPKAVELISKKVLLCIRSDYLKPFASDKTLGENYRLEIISSIARMVKPLDFHDVKALKAPKIEKIILGRNGKKKYLRAGRRITAKRNKIRMLYASHNSGSTKLSDYKVDKEDYLN